MDGSSHSGFQAWQRFIDRLDKEVDWHSPRFIESEAPRVEAALQEVSGIPDAFRTRVDEILSDPALMAAYAPHMNYPRILMDKFMLYMDPGQRFRVRMHRFKTRKQNGGAHEKVHSHKWHMSTLLLRGSYLETIFDVVELDSARNLAKLSPESVSHYTTGQVKSLPAGIPHQVINESDDECVITLFVRGPSLAKAAKIYDVPAGTYYETFDPLRQLKVGLHAIGRLNANFH